MEQFSKEMPEYSHRYLVKAGITGYAQVLGKYDTSPEDKLRYDLLYIKNYNLLLDVKLILQTIRVVFDKYKLFSRFNNNCQDVHHVRNAKGRSKKGNKGIPM